MKWWVAYVPELEEAGRHAVVLFFVVVDNHHVRCLLGFGPLAAAARAPARCRGPLRSTGRLFHIRRRGGGAGSAAEEWLRMVGGWHWGKER